MKDGTLRTDFWTLLWLSARGQAPLLAIALAFVALQHALGAFYPHMEVPASSTMIVVMFSTLLTLSMVLTAYLFAKLVLNGRPSQPTARLIREILSFLRDARTMALGLPVFVSLVLFTYAFSSVKGNIPVFQPFAWDSTLDRWDVMLHLGRRPWEWLQPVLGHWPITFIINLLYHLWFAVMFTIWLHYAFMEQPSAQRTRFFLSFMLTWMVGGGILAILFSSAGPCFFGAGHLGLSPDPYAPLMAYLHEADRFVPIWAVHIQDDLWRLHQAGSAEASVSAMPSMHNGTTLLFALASGGWPAWIRRCLWGYVAVIFVGSIHLGYHYAVDAYIAWALTLAIWWLAGHVTRSWKQTGASMRFRRAFAESPASL